ncbi:IS5 family transposase [Azospirillum sp. TSH58]|uniref:IS5 family transposase n=1 Tax=Azospirillum sp. TSH58 TaxID=664962 RepID=UPI001FFF2AEF|nr:IS5 family transposase [Azospirillum sp. TSH58]
MRRYELSDGQWERIADLMPCSGPRGGDLWRDHRQMVNGLMWKLNTGARWHDIPERYGRRQTVYDRFVRWRRDELFDRVRLQLDEEVRINAELWCIDGTNIRARRSAGGGKKGAEEPDDHALGRSHGGFGTKVHLVTDANGLPLAAVLSAGQRQELPFAIATLEAVRLPSRRGRPRTRPRRLAGDRGYSANWFRQHLRGRGIQPVIAMRDDKRRRKRPGRPPHFDREAYRRRNAVERGIGWLKGCRSVATRHHKLAVDYMAMLKLAMIQHCLRCSRLSDRT